MEILSNDKIILHFIFGRPQIQVHKDTIRHFNSNCLAKYFSLLTWHCICLGWIMKIEQVEDFKDKMQNIQHFD